MYCAYISIYVFFAITAIPMAETLPSFLEIRERGQRNMTLFSTDSRLFIDGQVNITWGKSWCSISYIMVILMAMAIKK